MEAKEFRIGNYASSKDGKFFFKIECINYLGVNTTGIRGGDEWDILYENILPIKLSKEILEKCGFISKDMFDLGISTIFKIDDEISLSYSEGTIWIGQYNTNIKHLHSLQNLYYSLTGKELEVKI